MVLISVRHVTPHSLLRHFPLTQHFLPKQIPSLKYRIFSFTVAATMSSTSKRVLVPVANGSEPIESVITIDVLRRSGADVTVASVEKQLRVDACHGVKIVADALVSDCRDAVFDLIALPGGMPGATNLKESEVLESIVKKQASAGRLYAAVCASPAVALGSWGLLKGLKATCYPSFMEQLAPACAATVESRVQQDGKVVTSRGPGTTMEFAVALVEQLYGKEKADEVSGPLVMRANHGDEYTIAEFNPIQWTFDNSPQKKLARLAPNLRQQLPSIGNDSITHLLKLISPVNISSVGLFLVKVSINNSTPIAVEARQHLAETIPSDPYSAFFIFNYETNDKTNNFVIIK
ncbi:hypothetical protein CUMW_276620, partial [Citrus unshiu]